MLFTRGNSHFGSFHVTGVKQPSAKILLILHAAVTITSVTSVTSEMTQNDLK